MRKFKSNYEVDGCLVGLAALVFEGGVFSALYFVKLDHDVARRGKAK